MDRIEFVLPLRLPLLNPQLRTHWARRRKRALDLAWHVSILIPLVQRPLSPWDRASVLIERFSPKRPDRDNLVPCAKPLLDILQPLHPKVRPLGLGVILNDSDDCIDLSVVHVQSALEQTRVLIIRQ